MAVPEYGEMVEPREIHTKKPKITKKDAKKLLLVSHELKIARALAGNDKTIRNRAVKSLRKWFHHRSKNLPFTESDFMRLWKGLFYSMWMSDKPLIQEECADSIASLLHDLPLADSLLLFRCGLATLVKEWFGIDQLRLDKFLMFVRRLVRQSLIILKKHSFNKEAVEVFNEILKSTVLDLNKKDATGLFMHFTEIFPEELAKVGEENIKPEIVAELLKPFMECMSVSKDLRQIKQISKFIFIYLIKQSDVGIEYQIKYDAWKKQGFPGTIDDMQKIEDDDSEPNEYNEVEDTFKPLDPRAGRVDVELPQIKFNPKTISDLLLKLKFTSNSTVIGRREMTTLSKHFRKLSHGTYPLGVKVLRLPKSDVKDMSLRKAVNRLIKFDNKISGNKKPMKRKIKEINNVSNKKRKIDSDKADSERKDSIEATEKNVLKRKKRKRDDSINLFTVDTPLIKKASQHRTIDPEEIFEMNSGVWMVYDQNESITSLNTSNDELGKLIENELVESHGNEIEETPDASLIKVVKQKKIKSKTKLQSGKKNIIKGKNKKLVINGDSSIEMVKTPEGKVDKAVQSCAELFPGNPWEDSTQEQGLELCVEKSETPIKSKGKGKSKMSLGPNVSTPHSAKKVKINTKLNRSQELHEYHSLILNSPGISYDGNKKPVKPALKISNTNSPINPFYNC